LDSLISGEPPNSPEEEKMKKMEVLEKMNLIQPQPNQEQLWARIFANYGSGLDIIQTPEFRTLIRKGIPNHLRSKNNIFH
jgi:hypothetical protein